MIYIDTATLSLNGGAKLVEVYVPLWFANGTTATTTNTTGVLLADGSTTTQAIGSTTSAAQIFKLNTSVPANTVFAIETTISANAGTTTAQLYDFTTSTAVAQTATSTTTTLSVNRSSQFMLTPGHAYGVLLKSSVSTSTASLTDASLIIFP